MKLTMPSKEVEVCDKCRRDTYLVTCLFCGGRHCLSCSRAIIAGCVHQVDVCQKCGGNEKVLDIVYEYAPLIDAVLEKRNVAITEASQQSVKKAKR